MSSSGTSHEAPHDLHRREPLLQSRQNASDNGSVRRPMQPTSPSHIAEQPSWAQREYPSYNPSGISSSSAPRMVPSNQGDTTRFAPTPFPISDMPAEARRQNIMAMDRKRRLTGSAHESAGRRRNMTGTFDEIDEILHSRTAGSDNVPSSSRPQTTYRQHRSISATGAPIIDLTRSPPQPLLPPPSVSRQSSGSMSGIYVLPRWQPDSEVSECPICQRPFTLWFRRHHCRKCGRVVCNDCSPHRITIPRQFIVNQPGPYGQTSTGGRTTVDLTGDDDEDEDNQSSPSYDSTGQSRNYQNSGIGGGEKVRLCNPCVPDPQPEPQPNYSPNTLSPNPTPSRRDDMLTLADALRSSRQAFHNNNSTDYPPAYVPHTSRSRPLPLPPPSRSASYMQPAPMNAILYPSDGTRSVHQLRNDMFNADQHRRHHGAMPWEGPQLMHNRNHSAESSRMLPQVMNRPRMSSTLDDSYIPRNFLVQPLQPRVRLNEEDICPICRRALPPKGPEGDETARESHIMECISSRDPANMSSSSRGPGMPPPPPRGPMHMLPFIATEKDCVADDGNIPECSICMVEYDVGDELARLECLCKFHRECISEWFGRKQECPVHKIS